MSNNDYFSIAYKILSYLKYCYENGIDVDVDVLSPGTLNISDRQFYQTLSMLSDDGHIKGVRITSTTSGRIVTGISKLEIASSGLQYL
nr:MAG TPA: YjcQ protein [Caudoviricetes sp.]